MNANEIEDKRSDQVKRIEITPEAIVQLFFQDNPGYRTNLPDDAQFVEIWRPDTRNILNVVVASDKWETVAEGQEIPEFALEFTEGY